MINNLLVLEHVCNYIRGQSGLKQLKLVYIVCLKKSFPCCDTKFIRCKIVGFCAIQSQDRIFFPPFRTLHVILWHCISQSYARTWTRPAFAQPLDKHHCKRHDWHRMNAIVYNLIFLKWNGRAHHLPSDFTLKSRHFAFQGQKFQDIAHRIYISNHVFQSCIHPSVDRDVQSDCGGMCAMVKSWILYIYICIHIGGWSSTHEYPLWGFPLWDGWPYHIWHIPCLYRGTCDGGGISYRFIPAMTEGLEVRCQGNVRNRSKLSGHSP